MFAPTLSDAVEQVEAERRRWSHLASIGPVSLPRLRGIHADLLDTAERLSGTSTDAQKRALHYYALYLDSERTFMFPLVATHGSLWGVTHTKRIERVLRALEPWSRRGRIARWISAIDSVRDINRRVFVEIYTTFYFTRFFGEHPEAARIIKPEVLALYNRVHRALSEQRQMGRSERREIYYQVFVHEQDDIVDPGLRQAAVDAAAPWLVGLLKHVRPRFAYFPRRERLVFTDFTDVTQRNREGLRALDFAEEVGPDRVLAAMSEY